MTLLIMNAVAEQYFIIVKLIKPYLFLICLVVGRILSPHLPRTNISISTSMMH